MFLDLVENLISNVTYRDVQILFIASMCVFIVSLYGLIWILTIPSESSRSENN